MQKLVIDLGVFKHVVQLESPKSLQYKNLVGSFNKFNVLFLVCHKILYSNSSSLLVLMILAFLLN